MKWLSERLAGPAQKTYAKPDPEHTFRGRLDGTRAQADEIVYEDDQVFAFRHRVDPTLEEWWETHVVIIPKRWVPTLLDMGPGEAELWARLIGGNQNPRGRPPALPAHRTRAHSHTQWQTHRAFDRRPPRRRLRRRPAPLSSRFSAFSRPSR